MLAIDHHHVPTQCLVPITRPWRKSPDGCRVVLPGQALHLSRSVTEIDLWTIGGHHLEQTQAHASGGWGFSTKSSSATAGWVTVNQDVFVYGKRPVIVYQWRG